MDVYETVKTIGSGSFGQVYMVRHKREGKNYVIKRVKTRDMSQKDLENTENEVKLLQKIRHANIVAYKDSFVDREQYLNIVMIYCDGGDMYTKIKNSKGKNFSEQQILDWLVQIALALLYLHERKILHRDLKTQNIFIKNGKIRLGDFGIAKVLDSTKDFANTCIGTPYYMSPELFKNKPYSYKSDVWALGCVLYEMCNLRHAFDAQSINGLAVKILNGQYPPLSNVYSKQLRDLITKMLSVKPSSRPNILDILNKPLVKKRVQAYMNECLNCPQNELAPTDVDDLNFDSLREQADKLNVFSNQEESQLSGKKGSIPIAGAINAKKIKKAMGQGVQQSKKTQIDEKKELLRLKKEIREKKLLEKKMKELEQEAQLKQKQLQDKIQSIESAQNKIKNQQQQQQAQHQKPKQQNSFNQKPQNNNTLLPGSQQTANKRSLSKKQDDKEESKKQVQDLDKWESKKQTEEEKSSSSSHKQKKSDSQVDSKSNSLIATTTTTGPINSYQEFSKIFNPKLVGLQATKTNRKSSHETPQASNFQSFQEEKQTNQQNKLQTESSQIDAREKVMQEKERRKKEEQEKVEKELEQIRQDNYQRMKEAQMKEQQQYRPSTALKMCLGEVDDQQPTQFMQKKPNNKKIEEDYTMYDEVKDDELEDIIEEDIEEESEEEKVDMMLTSQEEREERKKGREELKTLKTQLITVKERLAQKTMRIEEIKDTLKKSQLLMSRIITKGEGTALIDDNIIDEVVKEYENQEEDDENEDLNKIINGEDEEEYGDEEDSNDDGMDNGLEEIDPQILKLQERIKFLRHRCVSSLGNSLFDKAFIYLKSHQQKSADEIREQLIKILGEESIGFWAIMDQMIFFESILDEISTQSSDN